MGMPPRKIDKSHGFMQSIIKNQVLRDEYDKEQRLLACTAKNDNRTVNERLSPADDSGRTRTPRRAPKELYVPPHLKKKVEVEVESTEASSKISPELYKRTIGMITDAQKQTKRSRRSTSQKEARVLFKFEYEDDFGQIKSILVKEDDNAEDLAETFGNQLGLSKALRRALRQKLEIEMRNCLSS